MPTSLQFISQSEVKMAHTHSIENAKVRLMFRLLVRLLFFAHFYAGLIYLASSSSSLFLFTRCTYFHLHSFVGAVVPLELLKLLTLHNEKPQHHQQQ